MKQPEINYKRIVIKIGSSLFCSDNKVDTSVFNEIAGQITGLLKKGKQIVVVSSGAIALGMRLLGLEDRPKELHYLQAAAALGQNELMNIYDKFLRSRGYHAAQILLTHEDFNDRTRYLNAKNTLLTLLEHRKYRIEPIVPIINENDTVSTEEIKFGDNDRLSALVANLISADLLIILSDVDGLLDRNKKVIPLVDNITPEIKSLACPTRSKTCVGGMLTKIEAAKIAVGSGIPCVIANGRKKEVIPSVIDNPQKYGTLFMQKKGLSERERWIAFGSKSKGKIIVDDGAKKALLDNKSLLSVGVKEVVGVFASGSSVSVLDIERREIARGKVGVSSGQLEEIKGRRFEKEIIHRDNIVIL